MEFDLIKMIRERSAARRADVSCGIGDDAALLLPPAGHELAVSIDTLVECVHFLPNTKPVDLGWKALAVNLSDLAAMGAQPAWAVLSLTLPHPDSEFVQGFVEGFLQLADRHGLALVGGDTTQGPLTISVTVHGFVPKGQGLLRSGAQVGDQLFVTGPLGDAAAALQCLDEKTPAAGTMRSKLERPQPRVEAGLLLRGLAHAVIDISDGLLADLSHICDASGVGARLHGSALPCSEALVSRFGLAQAREFALAGGDAYELCFAAAPEHAEAVAAAMHKAGCQAIHIGEVVAGSGIRVEDGQGGELVPAMRSWEHFRA